MQNLQETLTPRTAIAETPVKGSTGAFGRWWNRYVALPLTRLFEGFLMRRQTERLYLVFGGHIFFQTLRTAVRLGLFSLLEKEGPLTRQEIAARLGVAEQPARIVILGLTVTGLLKKRGRRYSNSYLARRLLVEESPRKITAYVELQHRVMYQGLSSMLESVQHNCNAGLSAISGDEPTLYQRLAHHPETEQIFQDAMQELSMQANHTLARLVDLRGVSHLVDVGGGDGTNIIAMARRWPGLRATVFDSPTVCTIARANIAGQGLSDRLGATPGDCFDDRFPDDADCFLFAHFLTIWGEAKGKELLRKACAALPSGGKVILFNMMQHDDETGPMSAAVGSPYFLTIATGTGMLHTWSEYEAWMREAGFATVQRQALLRDHGFVIGTKA
jgi:hypothetical protein